MRPSLSSVMSPNLCGIRENMVSYTLTGAGGGSSPSDAVTEGEIPIGVPTSEVLGDDSGVINASDPARLIVTIPSIDLLSLTSSSSSSSPVPISSVRLVWFSCSDKEVRGDSPWCDVMCLAEWD